MTRLPLLALLIAVSGCHLLIPGNDPPHTSDLPSATAVQIIAGSQHSCALTSEGGVRCWGTNALGQLGAGTDEELDPDDDRDGRYMAMQVKGLETGVAQISTFGDTTCALTTAGGVKCWGEGFYGALGNGDEEVSAVPVDVIGLDRGVVAISVGYGHACALMDAGAMKCWGDNADGQLGNGTVESTNQPVDVVGLTSGVDDVHPSGWYSMARVGDAVKLWGAFAITNVETTPIDTVATSGVTQLAAGNIHACYINPEGGVMCWGDNESGAVGFWDLDLGVHVEYQPIPVDSLP